LSKVIQLVSAKPSPEPNPSIIGLLEHLLELARAGTLNGLVVVGGRETDGPVVATTGYVDFMLVGAGMATLNEIGADLLRNS
jgi:hypothetical protein